MESSVRNYYVYQQAQESLMDCRGIQFAAQIQIRLASCVMAMIWRMPENVNHFE